MGGLGGSSCHSLPSQNGKLDELRAGVNSELVEAVKTRYEKVIEDNENVNRLEKCLLVRFVVINL